MASTDSLDESSLLAESLSSRHPEILLAVPAWEYMPRRELESASSDFGIECLTSKARSAVARPPSKSASPAWVATTSTQKSSRSSSWGRLSLNLDASFSRRPRQA